MIKKTITYSGLDGQDITEDFYFNMTKAELTEKELVYPGGFAAYLQRIVAEDDRPAIIAAFKDLILSSVGIRGEDGKSFIKKGVAEAFEATEAFSALFMELVTDAVKSAEFFNGVMPKDLAEKMREASKTLEVRVPVMGEEPIVMKRPKVFPDDYTEEEIRDMSLDELNALVKGIPGKNISREVLMLLMKKQGLA